ncbi:MAG TPA: TonB-dependent receptor, partial [Novosphingobium sp.]|nr:TonB-dependent receptor [Novosphingobium sp.]
GADTSSSGEDASLRVVGRGTWQFEALAYLQARNFTNVVISAATLRRSLDQYATPSTGWGAQLELRPPLSADHLLRLGIDWRSAAGTAYEAAYNAGTGVVTARRTIGGRNEDLGIYAGEGWQLGRLALTGALRADRWSLRSGRFREANPAGTVTTASDFPDRSGWAWSFRVGTSLTLAYALTLRASAYSSIRHPTLNELYRPFVVFPVTTRANAALDNERLVGFEAGVDFTPAPGATFALTAFDNRVRHAIANVTLTPTLRERRNVDAIRGRGIEMSASLRHGALALEGSLAWTEARVEASGASAQLNGKRPAQTPALSARSTLSWRPSRGSTLALTVRHVGAQFEDDLEIDRLPPSTTFDAYAELAVRTGVALVLRGENLADRPAITRNQAGSLDLGAPRTLWAGVKVQLP